MDAKLYFNESDNRVLNKSLKNSKSITIMYKEDTGLVNPVIYLKSSNLTITNYNYIYISDLKRYYYIDEWDYSQQMYIIKCHIDVLMTYKKWIKNQRPIVKRSASKFNLYINDDRMNLRAESRTLTFPFPSGFLVGGSKTANFILTVNGGGVNSN